MIVMEGCWSGTGTGGQPVELAMGVLPPPTHTAGPRGLLDARLSGRTTGK